MPYCRSCGKEIALQAVFCPFCGVDQRVVIPPQTPPVQPPATPYPSFTPTELMSQAIRERSLTDHVMPLWMPFAPIILAVVVVLAVVGFIVALVFSNPSMFLVAADDPFSLLAPILVPIISVAVIAVAMQLYVMYKWINRMNRHLERTNRLYEGIASFFEGRGFGDSAYNMRSWNRGSAAELRKRNEGGFVISYAVLSFLGLVPIVGFVFSFIALIIGLYVLHFLNKDFRRHDEYEKAIWDAIQAGFMRLGRSLATYPISNIGRFPNRSTALYIILTIITIGIFSLYWIYTVTKDPNEHFIAHTRVESELQAHLA